MTGRGTVKARMVGAGADLIAERGLAVTMLEVIERAQAPRGSIYHHFPEGKPELAVAVAQQVALEIEDLVAHFSAKIAEPTPFLQRLVEHHARRLVGADYTLGCPLMGMVVAGEHLPELDEAIAESFTVWVRVVADALATKGLDRTAAESLARATVTGVEGAIVVSRASRDPKPFEDLKAMLALLVAAG